MNLLKKGRGAVTQFIIEHPEHGDEAEDLYELFESEIENGESEDNEFNLLINSLEDIIN